MTEQHGAYRRPKFEPMRFTDERGRPIEYGSRWEAVDGTPPEESYSVVSHPERFAPLHAVALALIDHLARTRDVRVEEGEQVLHAVDSARESSDVVRAVRLTPALENAAPVTFVLSSFPSVDLYAGEQFRASYPSCGCDACDEEWESCADELEWQVLGVVAGCLREWIGGTRIPTVRLNLRFGIEVGMGRTVEYRLASADGNSEVSSATRLKALPPGQAERLRARLLSLARATPDGAWQAWA